ncbi:hypothetical protein CRUP_013163 [Coryphaenoides rupestris]|nr:hypothetical protein CRUP_013163 [Coryphaenoides rupestris]
MVVIRQADPPHHLAPTIPVKPGPQPVLADLVTFPLDTAKVRLQGESKSFGSHGAVRYKGVFGTIGTMVRTEGPRSLYSGLVAGLQRQMSFASVRIGLYDSMKQVYTRGSDNVGIGARILAGCTTGAMAVAVAQPTDVVKVRFQAQVRLPGGGGAKRYNSTFEAYRTIARDEGIRGLWKGGLCEASSSNRSPSSPSRLPSLLDLLWSTKKKKKEEEEEEYIIFI